MPSNPSLHNPLPSCPTNQHGSRQLYLTGYGNTMHSHCCCCQRFFCTPGMREAKRCADKGNWGLFSWELKPSRQPVHTALATRSPEAHGLATLHDLGHPGDLDHSLLQSEDN